MSNRSGKLLSAVLVSSLAGGVLTLASHDPAHADDSCLSAPKNATPAGSHWYFHVERGTKRHCWYLGDAHGKTAQVASAKPSQPATAPATTSPKVTAPLQPEVANARAEFDGASSGSDQATDAAAPAADTTSANAVQSPPPAASDTSPSTVTTRWPDPSSTAPQTQPPAPAPVINKPQPASQLLGERTEPGPVVPRVASMPSPREATYSMPMLLGGLGGALALAGILGFAAVKFGSWSSRRRQGSIWDVADAGQPPPWRARDAEPAMPPRGRDPVRTHQEIEMQSRDILEILSKASRNAAT